VLHISIFGVKRCNELKVIHKNSKCHTQNLNEIVQIPKKKNKDTFIYILYYTQSHIGGKKIKKITYLSKHTITFENGNQFSKWDQ